MTTTANAKPYTAEIPVDRITTNPQQPRTWFDEVKMQELTASMAERGQLQDILVEEGSNGYILHSGERRLRAAKRLQWPTIRAKVLPALNGYGARERRLNALAENVIRADMLPMEKARALGDLKTLGMSTQEIVRSTGINQGTVEGLLLLLKLEPELQDLIDQKKLPKDPRVARALLALPGGEVRVKFGKRMARPGVTIDAIIAGASRLKETLAERDAGSLTQTQAQAPILKHSRVSTQPSAVSVNWKNVRAAAQGMCDGCDLKASLPGVPEPAWSLIVVSAAAVCDGCSIRPTATLDVCKECPGVELLKRLASVTKA